MRLPAAPALLRGLAPALLLAWPRRARAAVTCDQAPDCATGHRRDCTASATFENTCNSCLPGAHGISGQSNAACLAEDSCAAIFPGQAVCSDSTATTPAAPFIVPFGRCACDDGTGLMWPTAPGMCAQVFVSPAGLYTLQKCRTRTCDPASCSTLTEWYPLRIGEAQSFECRRRGSDSAILSDGCRFADTGRYTDSSLCGHPGFVASRVVEASNHAVNCELAPQCPASVLGGTRLEESCCQGTLYSREVTEYGQSEEAAPGFCSVGLEQGQVCTVTTTGPGWRGCSCLNTQGQPRTERQCTTECVAPGCLQPEGGIPRTPEAWLTSAVPAFLTQTGVIATAGAHRLSSPLPPLLAAAAAAAALPVLRVAWP